MIDFSLCLLLLIVLAVCASSMLRVEKTLLSKCLRSDLSYPFSGISGFIATAVYFVAIVSSILCVCCRVLGYAHCMNAYIHIVPLDANYSGNIDLDFATDEVLHGFLLLAVGYGLPWFLVFIRWLAERYKKRKALSKLNAMRNVPYKQKDFDTHQLVAIRQGLKDALTADQVMVYADPKYSAAKMQIIRSSYARNLTAEQIAVLADPAFSEEQMEEIRWGFEMGLSIEQVKAYADPAIDFRWMHVLYCNLMHQNEENKEKQNGTDSN